MSDVSKQQIKKALDDFEDDNFVDSKETLKQEIKRKVNDYLKGELGTKNDPVEMDNDEEEDDPKVNNDDPVIDDEDEEDE